MVRANDDENRQHLLLVEGPDDKAVAIRLRKVVESLPEFYAHDKGGIGEVLAAIQPEVLVSGRRVVGIVVDANDAMEQRWRSVRDQLREIGVQAPERPDRDGTIIEGNNRLPRVGIWIMPDNESDGELEDLLITMLPEDDRVWPLSQAYIDGIPRQDRKFKEKKVLRAQLYSWLATRREPRQSGQAIETGDLWVGGKRSMKFIEWLRRLFDDSD